MLRHVEHGRDLRANQVRDLRRGPHGKLPLARLVLRDDAARLHRDGNQPLVYDALLVDLVGLLERGIHVAALKLPAIRDVVLVAVV